MALAVMATIGTVDFASAQGADGGGRGDAVHPRHLHVHEDHVVVASLDFLHRLLAVVGEVDLVAELAQESGRHLPVGGDVIDHQDPQSPPGARGAVASAGSAAAPRGGGAAGEGRDGGPRRPGSAAG